MMTDSSILVSGEGGKSGGKFTEDPNTLRSKAVARILDLISEGEIKGLVDGDKSIFLDGTPVRNADGTKNFDGLSWAFVPGLPDQEYVPGFSSVEQPVANFAGIELKAGVSNVRRIEDREADAAIITFNVPALNYAQKEGQTLTGSSVKHSVYIKSRADQSDAVEKLAFTSTISGKCMSPYEQDYRVDLVGEGPWDIRVVRNTADSEDVKLVNASQWARLQIAFDHKFTYPFSALVGLQVSSEYFGTTIPTRAYEVYGLIVRVPSNYDPIARKYTGLWDGTFKWSWTNNPAWVFYDLVTNERYGAGISPAYVDKWSLYQIAMYCDGVKASGSDMVFEGVPDGFGGMEPRFTYNGVLNKGESVYTVLTAMASAFRGMTYWSAGMVSASQDRPAGAVKIFSPANVIEGNFEYTGTSKKARHTVAIVSWNNPEKGYETDYEVVEDRHGIARFGMRPVEVVAFGCTSRGQARRFGKWVLTTEALETDSVKFKTGFDAADLIPGEVILCADPAYAGLRMGGRTLEIGAQSLTLDAVFVFKAGEEYEISVMSQNGNMVTAQVANAPGATDQVILASPLPTGDSAPEAGGIFALSEVGNVEPRPFRTLSVAEGDNDGTYEVFAIEQRAEKFDIVDTSANFDLSDLPENNYQDLPSPSFTPAPSGLKFRVEARQVGTSTRNVIVAYWEAAPSAIVQGYMPSYRADSGNWVALPMTGSTEFAIDDPTGSIYDVRVFAVNQFGVPSAIISATFNLVDAVSAHPARTMVQNLRLANGQGAVFTGSSVQLVWDAVPLSAPDSAASQAFRDQFYGGFKVTVLDNRGNVRRVETVTDAAFTYDLERNSADGLTRDLRFAVQMFDVNGKLSAETTIAVTNDAPVLSLRPVATPAVEGVQVEFTPPLDLEYTGVNIYAALTGGAVVLGTPESLAYSGRATSVLIPKIGDAEHALRVVPTDVFGEGAPSDTLKATPLGVLADIRGLTDDIDALTEAYGDTANAEASAAAAKAAQQAAETAKANSESARDQAKGALDQANDAASSATQQSSLAAQAQAEAQAAASLAQGARSGAEGAQSAAQAAQRQAEINAGASAQSKSDAQGYATTASGKAEQAAQSADASGQSAINAKGSADLAITNAGKAGVFADQASKSQSSAAGSASEAATSASVSAQAYRKALSVSRNPDFSLGFDGWADYYGSKVVPSSADRAFVMQTPPGERITLTSDPIALTGTNQRFSLRVGFRPVNGETTVFVGLLFYDANGGMITGSDGSGNYPLSPGNTFDSARDGWIDREATVGFGYTSPSLYGGTVSFPAGAKTMRLVAFCNYNRVAGAYNEIDYLSAEDVTSQIKANESASAASASEKVASAKADASGQSADAAERSRQSAETLKGQAEAARGQAAQSASDADGSRNSAASFADVSASARDAARLAALSTIPDNFSDPANWKVWNNWGGDVQFRDKKAIMLMGGSIHSRAYMPLSPGRKYRVTMRHRVINQGGGSWYVGILSFGGRDDGVLVWATNGTSGPLWEWRTDTAVLTAEDLLAANPGAQSIAVAGLAGYDGKSDAEISLLRIEDVTSAEQARQSAEASSSSAQTAAASKKGAEESAAAALRSESNAKTSAGDAQSFRNDAAVSKRDAESAYSNALTQAGVSARASDAAVATVANELPSDAANRTFFRQNWSGNIDRPEDFSAGWTWDNGAVWLGGITGHINYCHRGITKLVPGRRRRVTAVWKCRNSGGYGTANIVLYHIGSMSDGTARHTPGAEISIGSGQPGWGEDAVQWARSTFELNDDDLIGQGCTHTRALFRYVARNNDESFRLLSLSLDDITSEEKSRQSAEAAAGSSSTAGASAYGAGESARAAQGDAARAQTKAGEAEASAGRASTSERNALGSANSAASTQAVTATTYRKFLEATGNETFDNGPDGWGGFPDGAMVGVASSYGRANVLRSLPGVVVNPMLGRAVPVTSPDQRFRLRVSVRCAAATSQYFIGMLFYDANGGQLTGSDGSGNYPLGASFVLDSTIHGWLDREVVVGQNIDTGSPYGGTTTFPPGTAYFRPAIYLNYAGTAGSVTEIDYFTVADVTSEMRSSKSADAASKSYSAASASEGIATQKASAASGSADTANTRAGEARASADRAAGSESNAKGSAQTASSASQLAASLKDDVFADTANLFPGFEQQGRFWNFSNGKGQLDTGASWEPNHQKGAGISLHYDNVGSYFYMAPRGSIRAVPGKRYRAGFWVWQWSSASGYGGRPRLYWEGSDQSGGNTAYFGATADAPEATRPFYSTVPNGAWQCYASDFEVTDAVLQSPSGFWLKPRINLDDIAPGNGYVIAGFFFREVTSEVKSSGFASAANSSASTAGAKADDAGKSAEAANQSRIAAGAANDAAGGRADAAQGSAARADASATAAATNSLLSAGYANTRGMTPNGTFDGGDVNWVVSGADYGLWHVGLGYRTRQSTSGSISSAKRFKVDVSRKYRLTASYVIHGNDAATYIGIGCYDEADRFLGNVYMPQVMPIRQPGGTVVTRTNEISGTDGAVPFYGHGSFFVNGTRYVRLIALMNYPDPQPAETVSDLSALYLEDITEEKNAAAQASIARDSAATASANAAQAQASSVLAASLSGGSINRNSVFADFPPISVPPSWSVWSGGSMGRTYGNGDPSNDGAPWEGSPWGFWQRANSEREEAGIYQDVPSGPGYFAVNATVRMLAGAGFSGSGVLVYGFDSGGSVVWSDMINFATTPDVSETVRGRGVGADGQVYRWSKVVAIGDLRVRFIRLYAMTNWSGFDNQMSSKTMAWLRCSARVASNREIAGGKVDALDARVTVNEGAIANVNGKVASYWKVETVAGNNRAQIYVHADANKGAGVDIVGDTTFKGKLDVTSSDDNGRTSIDSQSFRAYAPNGRMVVRLGRWS